MLDKETLNAIGNMFDEKIKPLKTDLERIDNKIEQIENNLERIDSNLERIDSNLERIDKNIEQIENNIEQIENNIEQIENNVERVETELKRIERVHGASLLKIEKEVGSVQDVYKLTVEAVVNTKKNQETIEQIANQTAANTLAIKKHTQQIKALELKVG